MLCTFHAPPNHRPVSKSGPSSFLREHILAYRHLVHTLPDAMCLRQFGHELDPDEMDKFASRLDDLIDLSLTCTSCMQPVDSFNLVDWQTHEHRIETMLALREALHALMGTGLACEHTPA